MKYVLYIIFIAIISSFCFGYYIKPEDEQLGHRLIGGAVVVLFLIWMPLFIYHRFKSRDIKKYMINDDFFEKIKNEADTFIDKK